MDFRAPNPTSWPIACRVVFESQRLVTFLPYLKAMEKLTKTDGIAPRIRFLIRDVLDLRRMKWVPRRETLKVRSSEHLPPSASIRKLLQVRFGMLFYAISENELAAVPYHCFRLPSQPSPALHPAGKEAGRDSCGGARGAGHDARAGDGIAAAAAGPRAAGPRAACGRGGSGPVPRLQGRGGRRLAGQLLAFEADTLLLDKLTSMCRWLWLP